MNFQHLRARRTETLVIQLTHAGGLGLQPSAHASAILPHGRIGQAVNGVAYQASDQGGSESRVSWSEVASPCVVGLPLGWILPRCLRVTTAAGKMVDGVREGEVRSETGSWGLFANMTAVLPGVSAYRLHAAPLRAPRGANGKTAA